jgi:hypothetical protein
VVSSDRLWQKLVEHLAKLAAVGLGTAGCLAEYLLAPDLGLLPHLYWMWDAVRRLTVQPFVNQQCQPGIAIRDHQTDVAFLTKGKRIGFLLPLLGLKSVCPGVPMLRHRSLRTSHFVRPAQKYMPNQK